jgi:acetyl-CoA decarbonylase/synthase complex subunit delta
MERMRMAALTQQDDKLQVPIICNLAKEVWKTKETRITEKEDPKMGDEAKRGILLEAMTATLLLMAGADILIMRHPEAVKQVKNLIEAMVESK